MLWWGCYGKNHAIFKQCSNRMRRITKRAMATLGIVVKTQAEKDAEAQGNMLGTTMFIDWE
jgi:ribosomal protein L2